MTAIMLEGEKARKATRAFSSETCYRILQLLAKESLDVSTISRRLKLSEAHVSGEVSLLQDLKLIKVNYALGKRDRENVGARSRARFVLL